MGSTDDKRLGLPYGDGYCRTPTKPPIFENKKIKGVRFTWYASFVWTEPEIDPTTRETQPYKCSLSGEDPITGPLLIDIFEESAFYSEKAANDDSNSEKVSPILLFVFFSYNKEKVNWPMYQKEKLKDYIA